MGAFPSTVQTSSGQSFHLAKQIGQGGEGAIYEIREKNDVALKLYWPTKAESRRDKISAMASAQWYKTNSFVAFPIDILFAPAGAFLGFVMRKVGGSKPVHLLFSPTSRKIEFAAADYRFLVRAASNIARAVASVHALSCVIGDVNHSSPLVSNKATSTLIDCDSFQIIADNKKFLCQVGTPEYTPPELQGARFDRVERSPNHDGFGLAVLLFQILFMGRHPFSGRYQGSGDMPLERAIGEYRFAYSSQSATTKMLPPPGAPLLTDFPPYIGQAFETAFGRAGPNGRPTASQWVALLESLEKQLVVCAADSSHHHVQGKPCPWCRMEQSYPGFVAFISAPTGVFIPTSVDISEIAGIIGGIRDPGATPNLQTVIVIPTNLSAAAPPAGPISNLNLRAYIGGGFSAVGVISIFFGGAAVLPGLCMLGLGILANVLVPKELKRLRQERSQAEVLWRAAQDAWQKQSGTQQFADAKRETDSLIRSLSDLPNEEKLQLQILEQKKREDQLTHYLERFAIANAKIPKIGSARKAVLRSFGIETAADIDRRRISGIQGFGPTLISSLMRWQQSLVARFVFNPNEPINPRDLSALKAKIASRKSELEGKIRAAVASLQQASILSLAQRTKLAQVANRTFVAAKQAELNEQAATGSVQKASKFISICCACFAALGLMMNESRVNQNLSDYNARPPVKTNAPTPLNPPPVTRQEAPSPPRTQSPPPVTSQEPSSPPRVQIPQMPSAPSMPNLNLSYRNDALQVQRRLIELGFLNGFFPDGNWGPVSQQALVEFKKQAGLGSGGNWDSTTQRALFSDHAVHAKETPAAINAPGKDVTTLPALPTPNEVSPPSYKAPIDSGAMGKPPSTPQLDLNNIEDAKRVQRRLIDLGFLFGSADGIWGPLSRRALEDFRATQKIGQGDTWDETTQQLLFGESAVHVPLPSTAPQSFVGGWGVDLADCRQSQGGRGHLTITARRAEAFGTVCEFQSLQQEGPNMWRLQARCANASERWNANIRFTIFGNKLTWSSERGTANYVKCSG